ncbi:hypothetical protein PENTCL1PPCAC_3150, partial [Pristionchus entomophagus]
HLEACWAGWAAAKIRAMHAAHQAGRQAQSVHDAALSDDDFGRIGSAGKAAVEELNVAHDEFLIILD